MANWAQNLADSVVWSMFGKKTVGSISFARVNVAGKILHVVQQAGMRGCGEACCTMLKLDHGVHVSIQDFYECNLTSRESDTFSLQAAGLNVQSYNIVSRDPDFIAKLRRQIEKHGPGILSMNTEIKGHVVVLDSFSQDSCWIRDPYHGWRIQITTKSLAARLGEGMEYSLLQVTRDEKKIAEIHARRFEHSVHKHYSSLASRQWLLSYLPGYESFVKFLIRRQLAVKDPSNQKIEEPVPCSQQGLGNLGVRNSNFI